MNNLFGWSGSGGFGILGSLLGLGGGFTPNTMLAGVIGVPGYAKGTMIHPGGLAVVGEKGPELLNLPRGSQVFPRVPCMPDLMRPAAQPAGQANVGITVDVRGANGNTEIMEMVQPA